MSIQNIFANNKRLILIIFGLVLFNLVIINTTIKSGSYNLNGDYLEYNQERLIKDSILTFLLILPIASLILGSLVALIPYKQWQFKLKQLRASLLILISINSVFALGLLINLILSQFVANDELQKIEDTNVAKTKVINEFKAEMFAFGDSAVSYFDLGIKLCQDGENKELIESRIKLKLNQLREFLNASNLEFSKNAKEVKLSQREFDDVFNEIEPILAPLAQKRKQLTDCGVNLN